ncbi:hypothetical protein BmR1_04g06006 [Babesia microti strain RI]|uniref:Uncharacterized protein n=1 Tax=Babesia microti (strain RI) TaxID=1133968 RepID=A0A1N6LXK3_BABMR|nr:hypothetical protein BmR1_04g06006 [Babesia microti strain RI]SIO73610.1 hypothetical protein BmR1_04g06006 [Babesia microti strain RI]|eukprot:XP_021337694.1 hypothetical protein BmR1_04g06006 [Babesia microti strain RI]
MFYPIGSMQSLFEALLECSREDFFIIFLLCSIFFFALAAFLNYEYSFNHVNHKRLEFRYYAAIVIAAALLSIAIGILIYSSMMKLRDIIVNKYQKKPNNMPNDQEDDDENSENMLPTQ